MWTDERNATIRRLYPDATMAELRAALPGLTDGQIYRQASALGVRKSARYMRQVHGSHIAAVTHGRFQKGHATWNKGKPHPTTGRAAATQFKKGRHPSEARNYQPIGTIRLNNGALQQKVTDDQSVPPTRRWVPLPRLVWERENGPIPAGHSVVFKPGCATTDPAQVKPRLLECISNAELMRRNSYHNRYPKDLALLIQKRGTLTRMINARSKA